MAGPRKPQRRSVDQWESLSAAQRKRYVSAGRTGTLSGRKGLTETQVRNYYLSGKSLTAARRGRASQEATRQRTGRTRGQQLTPDAIDAAQAGQLTDEVSAQLDAWRASSAFPDWLPQDPAIMGKDTAAILASIGSPPQRWESVVLEFLPDGSVNMTIQRKGRNQYGKAKPITVRLPDADAASEVGKWLVSLNHPGLTVEREGYRGPGPRNRVAA